MQGFLENRRAALVLLLLLATPVSPYQAEPQPLAVTTAPAGERLQYQAEWRLIHAGNVRLTRNAARGNGGGWETSLELDSAGLVSRLYKVEDRYSSALDSQLCALSSLMLIHEGGKHREAKVTFDGERRKSSYLERDLRRGVVVASQEIDIPPCVHDVIGGLLRLRAMKVEPGASVELPISDGKKSVMARVEAQEREQVRTPAGVYRTIRYEAYLFNNVLYRRKGRLFLWLTDDDRRLPVQIRVRMQLHIGTITLQLVKEERT